MRGEPGLSDGDCDATLPAGDALAPVGVSPRRVRVQGDRALGAGGDIKGNAIGDGSSATYIEHQTVQEAAPWQEPTWPVLIGVIPAQAGYYQHRPQAEELMKALAGGGTAVPCQVITGTGGVGKTQMAAEYARTAFHYAGTLHGTGGAGSVPEKGSGSGVVEMLMWVNATSTQAVTGAYALAAQAVLPGGAAGLDANQAAQQFLAWLRTTTRRWLVVLDDVTAPGTLTGLWPPEVPVGRVVVTTRSRDAAWSTESRTLLQVGLFTPQQSATYLRQALARPGRPERSDSDGEIATLADDLGHLPLALAQAAAYLVDTGRDIPRYRALLADRARLLAHLLPGIGGLPDAQTRTVNAVWDISLALADAYQPVGLAQPMMELTSVLDSHGIPEQVLTASAARAYLSTHRTISDVAGVTEMVGTSDAESVDEVDAEDALRTLHRLNLLDHDSISGNVRVHKLIQRAVREHGGSKARLPELVSASADALTETWPDIERDTLLAMVLRTNTDVLTSRNISGLWQDGAHPVLFRAGRSRGEIGEVQGATEYFERLADDAYANLGPDHPDTLAARHESAFWRGQAGDIAGTLAACERLLIDQLRVQGPDHSHTLTVRNEVAFWRGQMGDVVGAINATEELLLDQVRILGPDHLRTFATRGNLAGWRGEAGDVAGAVTAYEGLLADRLRVLGPDHPDTLTTRNNLAAMRGYAGDAAGAVSAFEGLFTELERVLGPDHPHTLNTRGNLAFWRGAAGDAVGSRSAYADLLTDRLRVLGPDHPDTLSSRSDLASMLGETGNIIGAVSSFEQLLADRIRVLGPDHPHTLATRSSLAGWRGEVGDLPGAITATEELLIDQLRVLGPDHPDTLATRNNLAGRRGDSGDVAAAVAAYEDLFVDQVRVLGPDHPSTFTTRGNLIHWRIEAGEVASSRIAYADLLADRLRVLGPDHPDTLATRSSLAAMQGYAGDPAGAVTAYAELLADMFRILGPQNPVTFDTFVQMEHWRNQVTTDPR